jgi:hypothetical protein
MYPGFTHDPIHIEQIARPHMTTTSAVAEKKSDFRSEKRETLCFRFYISPRYYHVAYQRRIRRAGSICRDEVVDWVERKARST